MNPIYKWFLWWNIRYQFLETFGERDYERTWSGSGGFYDYEEEPGWWWRGKFYQLYPDRE